jgi:hypothetical protein
VKYLITRHIKGCFFPCCSGASPLISCGIPTTYSPGGRKTLGIAYEIDLAKQSWARLWALIIGGTGIGSSIIMMIMIPIGRRRARKSAKGQWYDTAELCKRDLGLDEKRKDAQ